MRPDHLRRAQGAGLPTESSDSDPGPLLSLCLATYNRARYLDRYLSHHLGALDAAGIDYELVVSDNCSTDETPEILARYAAANPRMRVTRQPRNVGAYPNILTTLHQARGEIVVSIADDDLAIVDQLVAYVRRMASDPAVVMIQAPWLLMDETKDNAVIGKFYDLKGETRFQSGQFGACFAFVIEHHVFPECWLIRRPALPSIAGPVPRFTYSFFWMLANALGKGDVLFCPEPHLAATAIHAGAGSQVGNTEAMESWDVYRGGLEWLPRSPASRRLRASRRRGRGGDHGLRQRTHGGRGPPAGPCAQLVQRLSDPAPAPRLWADPRHRLRLQ